MMPFYLASAINSAIDRSKETALAWDQTWDQVMQGPLYVALNDFGIFLAVGTLLFWMVDWFRKLNEDEANRPLSELVFPVLVAFLLAQGGVNIANLSKSMRAVTNEINDRVVTTVAGQVDLEKKLSTLSEYSSVSSKLAALRSQCNGLVDSKEVDECVNKAKTLAQQEIDAYQSKHSGAEKFFIGLKQTLDATFASPSKAANSGLAVSRIASAPVMWAIEALLIAAQIAFFNLIELSMLLTALLGPVAVGTSLLPVGGKPIYLWLTAFWSLGLCKISLNVITGVFALSAVKAGPDDSLVNALLIGALGPILAMALASGGGMAIFNAVSQAGSMAGSAFAAPAGRAAAGSAQMGAGAAATASQWLISRIPRKGS